MATTLPLEGDEARAPRRGVTVAWVFAAWTAWALYWITEPLAMTQQLSHRDEALKWFQDAATWALLTLVILRLAERFPLSRKRLRRDLPVHLVAAVLVSFCSTTSSYAYDRWTDAGDERTYPERLAGSLRWNTTWYCYVLGIGLAVHYHRQARDRDRQAARLALLASRLETDVARAQLDAARMRLQPGLVYATLDAVARLAPRDPAAADALTVRLADLLRMVVDSFGADEVPLARDAAYLDAWAAVLRLRHGGPELRIEVAEDARDAAVPGFLLQPLAAALLHGGGGTPSRLHVVARLHDAELRVEMLAMDGAARPDAAAVEDLRTRLRRSHGDAAELAVDWNGARRTARVRLPFRGPVSAPAAEA